MLPRNGKSQLFVLWITYPATSGDTAAASAEPIFISPLPDPEKRGAISIGIAQKGPIVNSAKKNAALRQSATMVKLWERSTGIINNSEKRKPAITRLRGALLRSPVLIIIRSLTSPPTVSPTAPAKNTPLENS